MNGRWTLFLGTAACILLVAFGIQFIPMTTAVDPKTLPITSHLAKQLQVHVQALASPDLNGRKPGTPGNRAAADYIAARFREIGLESLPSLGGYGQRITPELGDNLIGVRPAATPNAAAPWLLIGAHFDHLGGNYLGADDNASAVAILIETARTFPSLTQHHTLFVAFNAEEPPYIRTSLMGSQHFVDHLPREIGSVSRLQAVIIMDLMGGVHWEPLQDVIFAAGGEKSPGLYRRVKESVNREASGVKREMERSGRLTDSPARTDVASLTRDAVRPLTPHASRLTVLPVGMHLIEEIPLVGQVSFSDYDAFRNASVPFLFLSAGRTPRYHQPTDLPDTLHYERMASTVGWFQDLVRQIDQDREPYRFEANRVEFADEVASLRPLVSLAADWNTRIPRTSPLSLARLRLDDRWLKQLDSAAPTSEDLKRLEKISIRLQCLVADFYGCFLI